NPTTHIDATSYIEAACLTWEGQQFQEKPATVEKLSSLPFQKIQDSITAQDHQPRPDSCIISMAVDQLKADEDPVMGFHQMFPLKNISDAWVCTNDTCSKYHTQMSRATVGVGRCAAATEALHMMFERLDWLHLTGEVCVVPAHALERLK
ncbi:hypothetical protein EI555_002668, partial [Monodon monoceros]